MWRGAPCFGDSYMVLRNSQENKPFPHFRMMSAVFGRIFLRVCAQPSRAMIAAHIAGNGSKHTPSLLSQPYRIPRLAPFCAHGSGPSIMLSMNVPTRPSFPTSNSPQPTKEPRSQPPGNNWKMSYKSPSLLTDSPSNHGKRG